MESMEKIRLNNGVQMPPIGYGVYRMTDPAACEEAVVQAIRTGYRLIDTAAAYGNEEAVGRAIRRCGVPREEIFLTTKLWIPDISYEGARRGLEASLRRLGQDSVDLLECNPFCQREGDLSYLRSKNILLQAWSPLAAGQDDLLHNETLARIGARHQKSAAQVVLRWLTQRGIVPLVKSANPRRMAENLDIFDFTLSPEELADIAALDRGRTCFPPRDTGKTVVDFLTLAAGK